MSSASPSLAVDIRDLPTLDVIYLACSVDQAAGTFSTQIGDGFERVKRWAERQGHEAADLLLIGVPHMVDRQLVAYECCVRLPSRTSPQTSDLSAQQIPGGRYAVLTLEKDSATIGDLIGRFFAEYVPQHALAIDETRPSYEVYHARTMEYCVPIR